MTGRHAAPGVPDAPRVKKTGPRRASTAPVPGSDPTPQALPDGTPVRAAEDTDEAWGSRPPRPGTSGPNDDRLKQDVPPHW
ncbi:hypothetical protein VD659_17780 [Herbiconiux sp. 11R-BC]|uniref:hypothetical protein n=1 Tax=Herbiconiux sp. 11R-BC TaxID=3111637 RepID=UPI003C099336